MHNFKNFYIKNVHYCRFFIVLIYNTDVVYNNVVVYNNNNCLEKFRLGRVRSKKNSWTLFVIYYFKGERVEIIAEDGPYVVYSFRSRLYQSFS